MKKYITSTVLIPLFGVLVEITLLVYGVLALDFAPMLYVLGFIIGWVIILIFTLVELLNSINMIKYFHKHFKS